MSKEILNKYIERIKTDFPEDDKLMIDLLDFQKEYSTSIPQEGSSDEDVKQWEIYKQNDHSATLQRAILIGAQEMRSLLGSKIEALTNALRNYDGIFNNPVARRKNDTEIANECRRIGQELINSKTIIK